MAYATQDEMQGRFSAQEIIDLTDPAGTGVLDSAVLNRALNDATAVIDGYLRTAYSLPLASVPAELVRVCCDLARYYLYDDRATEQVKMRRDEAISWLRDVSAGRTSLGLDAAGEAVQGAIGGGAFSAAPRVFTATTLAGFLA